MNIFQIKAVSYSSEGHFGDIDHARAVKEGLGFLQEL